MDKNCALHPNDDWPSGIFFIKVGNGNGMCAIPLLCSLSDQSGLQFVGRVEVVLRSQDAVRQICPKPMEIA
jgi:hypothetical protein